jgi:chemotaxis protein CheX
VLLETDDIQKVAESVWSTMLGMELVATGAPSKLENEEFLTASVSIIGDWEGLTVLHCSVPLAKIAASTMLGSEDPQPDEIRDALGELANMTGGNIKPLLPGKCELSLPSIIDGKGHHIHIPGSQLMNHLYFECGGEPLEVLVFRGKQGLSRAITD